MQAVESLVRADAEGLLRCPDCHAAGLDRESEGMLVCGTCARQFPIDPQNGVLSLFSEDSESGIKSDIRAWWGDLYRQLYAAHETTLSAEALAQGLGDLEDMFRMRGHLAVVEMPLEKLSGLSVLEIGPGSGAHSALFKRHGASVVSVDITPERVVGTAIKLALTSGGKGRSYHADAENLPFRDDSFDIAYSNGVLHHSENTDHCIAEVERVLKPGGKAVIMLYSRHSSTYWFNIVPRAILTLEMFRWPEAQWIGRLTEGKPKFGATKNPITRVYSKRQIKKLFGSFRLVSLRKNSFQFDNFCVPRLTQIRAAILKALGCPAHPGGVLVYGKPTVPDTAPELALGPYLGFSWNIVAEKSSDAPEEAA